MRTAFITLLLGALIVFGGLKVLRLHVEDDAKDSIAKEFALSDESADFVLECILRDGGLSFSDAATKRSF